MREQVTVQGDASALGVLDGRYQLRREIARGRHGAVYEAEHLITRVRVAIKTLARATPNLAVAHARLVREARILGVLRHPNVVAVLDAGECASYGPYLVLEMIEGRPLDGILLTRHTLPVGQTIALTIQLCAALRDVHQHGIVHRDVKPSNVLIARAPAGDRVELIDFGVASLEHEKERAADKLTQAGEVLGTIEYTAPEQLMGKGPIDARADVYAVGVIVYECLTGEVPYSGTPAAVIGSMLAGTRPPAIRARRDDVSLELEAAVRKALELSPSKRYASAAELAHACITALAGIVPAIELLDVRDDCATPPARTAAHPPAVPSLPTAPRGMPAIPGAVDNPQRRRKFARAPYVTPVRVQSEQGETFDGRTEDLSEGGILMVSDSGGADGQRVTLRLPLPVSGRVVKIEATTKWIKTRRAQRAIGVEFIDASEDVRKEIRAYVALMTGAPSAVFAGLVFHNP